MRRSSPNTLLKANDDRSVALGLPISTPLITVLAANGKFGGHKVTQLLRSAINAVDTDMVLVQLLELEPRSLAKVISGSTLGGGNGNGATGSDRLCVLEIGTLVTDR